MRITADLLSQVERRMNPLDQRELVLRELGVPAIENMGAALDECDAWDLSHNRLARLENFPRLVRLSALYCAGNVIETIDDKNMSKNVPNITMLTLSHNNISTLAQVANIGKACPKLEYLSLSGNPVTGRQHYRLYTIHQIPTLKVLDFEKVKAVERDRAQRLANSAAGAALQSDVQNEATAAKTFTPGEGLHAIVTFTMEQKEQIRELLANAASAKEVEEIENAVKKGFLPPALMKNNKRQATPDQLDDEDEDEPPVKAQKV
jgi:U2 small nuclear ribonucleoprotein A'